MNTNCLLTRPWMTWRYLEGFHTKHIGMKILRGRDYFLSSAPFHCIWSYRRQPSAWASRWWLLCNVHCRYSCSTKNSLNIFKSPHWISSRRLRGLRWVSFFWMTKIFENDSKFFMEKGVLQKKQRKWIVQRKVKW